mmetsp:Transcript_12527/g.35397  ORF Transcript_12527/g.35397 Transcript_12527/m.35397 type:complete len:326 (+) Transcript_12527:1362-2339(+)
MSLMRQICMVPPPPLSASSLMLIIVHGSLGFHWKSTTLPRWPQCWNSRPSGAPWNRPPPSPAEGPEALSRSHTLSRASSPPEANTERLSGDHCTRRMLPLWPRKEATGPCRARRSQVCSEESAAPVTTRLLSRGLQSTHCTSLLCASSSSTAGLAALRVSHRMSLWSSATLASSVSLPGLNTRSSTRLVCPFSWTWQPSSLFCSVPGPPLFQLARTPGLPASAGAPSEAMWSLRFHTHTSASFPPEATNALPGELDVPRANGAMSSWPLSSSAGRPSSPRLPVCPSTFQQYTSRVSECVNTISGLEGSSRILFTSPWCTIFRSSW